MALPKISQDVIDNVEEAEAEEKREKAVEQATGKKRRAPKQKVAKVAVEAKVNLPATGSSEMSANPLGDLAELGFTDLTLDFTSFPTVTLNKGKFSTAEHKSFGTEFEFLIMQRRKTWLFRGELDRDTPAELVYSNDQVTANKDGRPITEYQEDWDSRGWKWEKKEYVMVMGTMIDGPHEAEIVQLQISPTSIGRLDGFLVTVALKKEDPRTTPVRVTVGEEIGQGIKAFNPWVFKRV